MADFLGDLGGCTFRQVLDFVPLQRIANRLVNLFETHTYTTEVVFDHAVEQLEWNVGNNIVF